MQGLTLRFQKHLPIGQVEVRFNLPECDQNHEQATFCQARSLVLGGLRKMFLAQTEAEC